MVHVFNLFVSGWGLEQNVIHTKAEVITKTGTGWSHSALENSSEVTPFLNYCKTVKRVLKPTLAVYSLQSIVVASPFQQASFSC